MCPKGQLEEETTAPALTVLALLDEHGIEVGAGLGEFAGRAWRIGLMGHTCQERNVCFVLAAIERLLGER